MTYDILKPFYHLSNVRDIDIKLHYIINQASASIVEYNSYRSIMYYFMIRTFLSHVLVMKWNNGTKDAHRVVCNSIQFPLCEWAKSKIVNSCGFCYYNLWNSISYNEVGVSNRECHTPQYRCESSAKPQKPRSIFRAREIDMIFIFVCLFSFLSVCQTKIVLVAVAVVVQLENMEKGVNITCIEFHLRIQRSFVSQTDRYKR